MLKTVGTASIGYSPKWGGVTNAGSYVVLQAVLGAATSSPVTNDVSTFAADVESSYSYTPGDGTNFVRFIHRVYSSGGVEIGEPLASDVVFGASASQAEGVFADCRTNSLRLVVGETGAASLVYSTRWATNAASVSISAVKLSGQGGAATATNAMHVFSADADGVAPMRGVGLGWWRLLCRLKGESGETLLEYLTDEFRMKDGLLFTVR